MNSFATSRSQAGISLSRPVTWFLIFLALVALTVFVVKIDTPYTQERVVSAQVTAKTEALVVDRYSTPKFLLALKHTDGRKQDFYTTFAEYTDIHVSDTIKVSVSDSSLGYPRPPLEQIWLAFEILMVVACIGAFLRFIFVSIVSD